MKCCGKPASDTIGVQTAPGDTQLIRMESFECLNALQRVKATTACLDAPYAAVVGIMQFPAIEAVLTMVPRCPQNEGSCFSICSISYFWHNRVWKFSANDSKLEGHATEAR
jgi:hypothetical protein